MTGRRMGCNEPAAVDAGDGAQARQAPPWFHRRPDSALDHIRPSESPLSRSRRPNRPLLLCGGQRRDARLSGPAAGLHSGCSLPGLNGGVDDQATPKRPGR